MEEDIVERLREWKDSPLFNAADLDPSDMEEAADEIERLRKENAAYKKLWAVSNQLDHHISEDWAKECERLREQNAGLMKSLQLSNEALKTFANNVKQANAEIDKNWAETINPLKAENERLRQQNAELVDALEQICSLRTIPLKNRELRVRLLSSIDIAKAAIAKTTEGE